MTIADLIKLAENRLATLNGLVAAAFQRGDTDQLAQLDVEVNQTQATLDTLRGL